MALSGGFFSKKDSERQKPREALSFLNVGNEPFHAVAVALIDSLYKVQRGHDALLKKILERFYIHFPKYVSSQPYLTLPERMRRLLDNSRKSELVDCLAYVLRQFAIDESYANPLKYRDVFSGLNPQTSKSYLRDPQTKLPASALNALAQSLGINIILSFKELGKELRKKEVYTGGARSGSSKLELVLQVQSGQYFPAVSKENEGLFAYVGKLAVSAPKPVENTSTQEGTLEEIIGLIAQDNKQLLQSYDQWRKTLLSMVTAGELTCAQLIDLYISFLPAQSISSISLPALEQSQRVPAIAGVPVPQEQQTIELLADALADWISTEQIEPDKIFDYLDQNKDHQSSAALK